MDVGGRKGESKLYRLVGVSFGLLCILQSALNVSLRLHAVGFSDNNTSTSNFTLMSAGDNRALILESEQLLQDKDHLVLEMKQLLLQINQLLQGKNQLADEKKGLQVTNRRLTDYKNMLNAKILEKQNQIHQLWTIILVAEENNPRCPLGWWTYNSSCYQLSSTTNTWEYARKDCVRKGAHLVILNNKMEERVVRILGGAVKMWMGLSGQKNPVLSGWTWTWVDGSLPSFTNWNDVEPDCLNTWAWSCAYIDESRSHLKNWFLHTCQEHHYWMCEKECSNI
ncbi:C-type lectin domain family 4 member E-like isoform X2 [Xiphias gladius]|uniref:C-type lectin domain family 4 member E-like isoform X2 n=1 Tax=Xiphias gladius TaxID=8245 RepID=UPI001A9869AB|nr:C-type lectin domain family 4 member E-like isoform X2 [Xiphias gladius]